MVKIILVTSLISLMAISQLSAQISSADTLSADFQNREIKGTVLDFENGSPLPYANIYVLHKNQGAITNEQGHFTINISDLEKTDTLRFQYIGYKTRKITIEQLEPTANVQMEQDIINLNETVIFGSTPDPVSIVKKVLENKELNYKKTTSKKQTFIREREIANIENFQLKYKKSTIDELDRETIQMIEDRTPEVVASYTDFLSNLYFTSNKEDSIRIKIDPIRMVSLKEDYLDDLDQLENLFEGVLANTSEEEYWKIKSGIFGSKLDMEEEEDAKAALDSLADSRRKLDSYGGYVMYQHYYSTLSDKDQWEFLHKTGKYKYTVVGGTWMHGEDVYIIDFEPRSGGNFIGRMYIAKNTFALIRADYNYAPGKTGTDFQLLGVGYTENLFTGSIYFEKKGDNYLLKYFSYKLGYEASIDRNLALFKKKKRFLFDKKLKEIKVGVELALNIEESLECVVLDYTEISNAQFDGFIQQKDMEIIFVDQFDENLWKGYSIIEPIQQMKEYKKLEVSNSD